MTDPTHRPRLDLGELAPLARQRIADKIVVTDSGCWEYQAHRTYQGYCYITLARQKYRVHRASFAAFNGPFDASLLVCHRCDNPPCCNPAHLFLGDHKVNAQDASLKGRLSGPGPRGLSHPSVTIPTDGVREAIRRYEGGESQRSIARDLGVHQTTVSAWVRGKARADLCGAA